MTTAPKTLRDLAAFWKAHGGVNLGIVGDEAHTARPSYHNGEDVITANGWTAATDYSIRLQRDRAGLTNAAAAIDLGKLEGTFDGLQDFSRWLVGQAQSLRPGTNDIREIIYSPDGVNVQRYSGVDGAIHTGTGNGDPSHRFHTHISYYRDSERRDKVRVFAPYFTEAEMLSFTLDPTRAHHGEVEVAIDKASAIRLDDGELIPVHKGEFKEHGGFGKLAKPFGTGTGAQADRQSGWLLYGPRPAWLLAYAAREVPTAGDDKRFVAIAVDGVIDKSTEILV